MRAWLSWLVLFCVLGTPALGVTVQKVPRPPRGTWAVDHTSTRVLTQETKAEVDRIGTELNDRGLGQLSVVVVDTTSGRPPREFALDLFNRWGIGHAGRDDGVLLFVALGDRKAEIILGNGVDGPADQEASDAVMADGVVPGFKRRDPNSAVLQGARGLKKLIENSSLNNPNAASTSTESPPTMDAVADTGAQGYTPEPEVYRPEEEESSGLGLFAGGAGVLGAAGLAGRAVYRRRPRKCVACGNPRVRLDERADDAHLDKGQRLEESMGSVDYDVWWCDPCEDAIVDRYGALFTLRARCDRCNYVTVKKTSRTLRAATYDHGGEVEVTRNCHHCHHISTSRHSTPRRTRSSSSSSGSSRSSSSFGGGRSSGGGSSGSW